MTAAALPLNHFEADVLQELSLSASGLREVAGRVEALDGLSTATVVRAFHEAKVAAKAAEEVNDTLRKTLLTRLDQGVEDVTGIVHFKSGKSHIEARPRTSTVLDSDKMTALLKKEGLYDEGVNTTLVVKDPTLLLSGLTKLKDELQVGGHLLLANKLELLMSLALGEEVKLDEKKLDKLAKKGRLDVTEAAACYTTKVTTHAFFDVTP